MQSEPTLGLDVLWALVGAPTGCGIQQEALEPRFGSRGESCGVYDLCPLIWVHVNVSWRGAQIGQHPDIPAAGAVSQGAYPRRWWPGPRGCLVSSPSRAYRAPQPCWAPSCNCGHEVVVGSQELGTAGIHVAVGASGGCSCVLPSWHCLPCPWAWLCSAPAWARKAWGKESDSQAVTSCSWE